MGLYHRTIPPIGTVGAIDEPQWAESHVIDASGLVFDDLSTLTSAAAIGSVKGVNAVMGGAGTSCGTWSNQLITTTGTATLTLNAFNGTLAGLVPSSAGGSTNYLRADGSYAQPPGVGVTGVNFVVAGPGTSAGTFSNQLITTAGTATLTLNTFNGTLAGLVPSSAGGSVNFLRADGVFAATPDAAAVTGVNAVMAGAGTSCGTWSNQLITTAGTSTLTLNAFNGTLAGLVPSSAGGSTNYLRADGSYAQPPGTTVGANPSVSVALTGTNGVATTYMRSDASPALDVTIAPSWSGAHIFSHALVSRGNAGDYPAFVKSAIPYIAWNASGQAADAKVWEFLASGTNFIGRPMNDAGSSGNAWVTVARVATSATLLSLAFGNATDNPGFSFLGTGTTTHAGVVNFQGTGAQVLVGTSTAYAWGTGTKYPIIQLAGVGSLYGTDTTGVVLTGGGLYYNGTNFIYGQAGTGIIASLGTGSFTVSCVNTSGTAAGTATPTVVFSIGGTVTSNLIQGYGPVAAALVDMTPDRKTYIGTLAQGAANLNGTATISRSGNIVSLWMPIINGTAAGATATSVLTIPMAASFQNTGTAFHLNAVGGNGTTAVGGVAYSGTTFTLTPTVFAGTFTGTLNRGLPNGLFMTWPVT